VKHLLKIPLPGLVADWFDLKSTRTRLSALRRLGISDVIRHKANPRGWRIEDGENAGESFWRIPQSACGNPKFPMRGRGWFWPGQPGTIWDYTGFQPLTTWTLVAGCWNWNVSFCP